MERVGTSRVCLALKREMGPSSHLTVRQSKVMGSACDMLVPLNVKWGTFGCCGRLSPFIKCLTGVCFLRESHKL
jgi:hypothetical protein